MHAAVREAVGRDVHDPHHGRAPQTFLHRWTSHLAWRVTQAPAAPDPADDARRARVARRRRRVASRGRPRGRRTRRADADETPARRPLHALPRPRRAASSSSSTSWRCAADQAPEPASRSARELVRVARARSCSSAALCSPARRVRASTASAPTEPEDARPGKASIPDHAGTRLSDVRPAFAWIPAVVRSLLLALAAVGVWWASVRAARARRARARRRSPSRSPPSSTSRSTTCAPSATRGAPSSRRTRGSNVCSPRNGIRRRPSDAPLEYLNRVLGELSVSPASVRRLTQLFERAKFSHHASARR